MRLRLLQPERVMLNDLARKVIAEAENGSFCLLPRHVDFAAALAPGILCYETEAGIEHIWAIDEGVLVKCADEVLVSTRKAVRGDELGRLREVVANEYRRLQEHEKVARSALARLEAGVVRRFLDLK